MKKLIACLLAFLVLTGCTGKTETQFKEYDVPQGEHKIIELMNDFRPPLENRHGRQNIQKQITASGLTISTSYTNKF